MLTNQALLLNVRGTISLPVVSRFGVEDDDIEKVVSFTSQSIFLLNEKKGASEQEIKEDDLKKIFFKEDDLKKIFFKEDELKKIFFKEDNFDLGKDDLGRGKKCHAVLCLRKIQGNRKNEIFIKGILSRAIIICQKAKLLRGVS